jgi:hypothetical protein
LRFSATLRDAVSHAARCEVYFHGVSVADNPLAAQKGSRYIAPIKKEVRFLL